jgi:hypothetical protein
VNGFALGAPVSLALGLVSCLTFGLAFWLYRHWVRHRLATQGLLPSRLKEFVDWCASFERGWLRVSDAYEFRHRELFE